MKFHPYSEIFPPLAGTDLNALAADIKANGLREAIWLYDGQILDGRNRFTACRQVQVEPSFRDYTGDDPLGFVVSLNITRRHLTVEQRAMAGARIATLQRGHNQHTARAASSEHVATATSSQSAVAEQLGVSRHSILRARKVIDGGSKRLQAAVESGDVSLSRAAAVVELPKSDQLAATSEDDGAAPEPDETARIEAYEREYAASIDKVMGADDKLAAAHIEIRRQAEEIAVLKLSRDQYMNGQGEAVRRFKAAQRRLEQREKDIKRLAAELEKLRERIAIMEAA
jgi:hypothetical protein